MTAKEWYQSTGWIVALTVLFFPLGLALGAWNPYWSRKVRWALGTLLAVVIFGSVAANASSGGQQAPETAQSAALATSQAVATATSQAQDAATSTAGFDDAVGGIVSGAGQVIKDHLPKKITTVSVCASAHFDTSTGACHPSDHTLSTRDLSKADLVLAEEGGHNFKTTTITLQLESAPNRGDWQTIGSVPLTVGLSYPSGWFSLAHVLQSLGAQTTAGQQFHIEADEGNTLLGTTQFALTP